MKKFLAVLAVALSAGGVSACVHDDEAELEIDTDDGEAELEIDDDDDEVDIDIDNG